MKKKFLIVPNWLLCLIVTIPILVGMISEYPPLHSLDLKVYDIFSRLRQHDLPSPVVIIEIDPKSIEEIGPWPWPRLYLANIISAISAAKAKAIGTDILYTSRIVNPALDEIGIIRKSLGKITDRGGEIAQADNLLRAISKKIDHDAILVSAAKKAQNLVLPFTFEWGDPEADPEQPTTLLDGNYLEKKATQLSLRQSIEGFHNPILALKSPHNPTGIQTTFSSLAKVAQRHGQINLVPDQDGLIRRHNLLTNYQDKLFPSLSLQMSLAYDDQEFADIKLVNSHKVDKAIHYANKRLPISSDYKMFIDYSTNPFVISRFSASDLLANKIPKGIMDDKLVLVGLTDPSLVRTYRTPAGLNRSQIEITAAVLENIVNNSFIQRPGWAWLLECLVLLYFGIILSYITDRLNVKTSLLILATFLISWWGVAAFMFINNGFWFYIAPHTLTVCLGFSLQKLNHHQAAPKKKRDEHTEMNKMLGLSFQAQGLLDMAFDSFRKCSLNDPSVKEAIYNLALDFERKRMFNKAISAYEYLVKGGKHKDAHDRIWRLRRAESKTIGGTSKGDRMENTVIYHSDTKTRPTLGRYEVIKEIGKGAIGTVYLGRDPKINRKVAIKTLRYDEVDGDQLKEIKERFFREAEAAGRLSHPNIVTIYDAGEDYDITYMAMEYLDGHDLARHCKSNNLLPAKVILNIIIRVAFALDYAHKHKVIHRDIKPANIMLTEKGHVKVTDFGIARLTSADSTQTGVILGTPNYMSPEQVLGKKLDGRSDIFSLGAVFYEMLTGQKPFKSSNIGNLMHNIASAKFQPISELRPDTPPCCEAIVSRMMTKSRTKRFATAGEVVIEAQKCLGNL